MSNVPVKQPNHRYIETLDPAFFDWLDIHYGEHNFEGTVTIGYKADKGVMPLKSCRITKLKEYLKEMHVSNRLDYYLTANTVTAGKRQLSFLFSLNNIVIDIDCHDDRIKAQDKGALVEAFIWRAKHDYWNEATLPKPNSIVRTGRGVQLWWAIKPCAVETVWYYDQIKSVFLKYFTDMLNKHEELDGLSVDISSSKNNVGYFRLPCTYNTGARKYSSLEILHRELYSTQNLFEVIKPGLSFKISPTPKGKKAKPAANLDEQKPAVALDRRDISLLKECQYRCGRRVAKFIQLRNLRNRDIGSETRDLLCLIVYCELRKVYEHEQALDYLRQFNDGFKEPFTEDQLQQKISSAKDVCYLYSNKKIIEVLQITPEEQDQIDFYPANPDGWKRRRPNASRDEVRRIKREGRDAKIIELHEKGLSRTEIGRELGINRKTAAAVIKKWIENQSTVGNSGDPNKFLNCNIGLYNAPHEEQREEINNIQPEATELHQQTSEDAYTEDIHAGAVVLVPVGFPWHGVDLTKPVARKKMIYIYRCGPPPGPD